MAGLDNKGRTLWEMFLERIHHQHDTGNGAGLAFYNPLDLRIPAPVPIAYANGPEYAGYDFAVQEIRQYLRRIQGQEFVFTDYVLRGINKQNFEAEQTITARVRVVPNAAGAHDALLLRVEDEFAFAEDFLAVLKDTTGQFEITDDQGAKASFTRINDLREPYEAAVLVITETTADGKAAKSAPLKLEYWDYWRDADIGEGHTAKEFLFVELNSTTGWFQLWRGKEYFS